jgi:putative tricarboxylic transport membrane protein
MKVNDLVTGVLLMVFAVVVFHLSQGAPSNRNSIYGASFFPRLVAILLGACGVYLASREFGPLMDRRGGPLFAVPAWAQSRWHLTNFLLVLASLVVYILLSDVVGFDIIGTVVLFALFASLRRGRLLSSFLIALVSTGVIHYVFGHFLRVPLPWGILVEYAFF